MQNACNKLTHVTENDEQKISTATTATTAARDKRSKARKKVQQRRLAAFNDSDARGHVATAATAAEAAVADGI